MFRDYNWRKKYNFTAAKSKSGQLICFELAELIIHYINI